MCVWFEGACACVLMLGLLGLFAPLNSHFALFLTLIPAVPAFLYFILTEPTCRIADGPISRPVCQNFGVRRRRKKSQIYPCTEYFNLSVSQVKRKL